MLSNELISRDKGQPGRKGGRGREKRARKQGSDCWIWTLSCRVVSLPRQRATRREPCKRWVWAGVTACVRTLHDTDRDMTVTAGSRCVAVAVGAKTFGVVTVSVLPRFYTGGGQGLYAAAREGTLKVGEDHTFFQIVLASGRMSNHSFAVRCRAK